MHESNAGVKHVSLSLATDVRADKRRFYGDERLLTDLLAKIM
ncbi:MAG: hypothetical protein O2880_09300 [Proteobacteria bacterium]|nr:hypothetical protein [Pseudomonadota bacterium]